MKDENRLFFSETLNHVHEGPVKQCTTVKPPVRLLVRNSGPFETSQFCQKLAAEIRAQSRQREDVVADLGHCKKGIAN
jgi:hypothetical protein